MTNPRIIPIIENGVVTSIIIKNGGPYCKLYSGFSIVNNIVEEFLDDLNNEHKTFDTKVEL